MRINVIKETVLPLSPAEELSEYRLYFQFCRYNYDDGSMQEGYRFIGKKNGKLQPVRGQTRIPSIDDILALVSVAKAEGWGDNKC